MKNLVTKLVDVFTGISVALIALTVIVMGLTHSYDPIASKIVHILGLSFMVCAAIAIILSIIDNKLPKQ